MAQPIIFTITEAGKHAALTANADSAKLKINLTQVAVGTAKHLATGNEIALTSEVKRGSIVSGDIEVDSNTLRFTGSMSSDTKTDVYEVGLFTDDGILFALAGSNTTPLFSLYPDITFVIGFGLSLQDVAADSVTVTTDPNGALSLVIMEQHLAAPDPHPQYLNASRLQFMMRSLYPIGYQYHTHEPVNPKPVFDEILGINTAWRRITGKIMVATDPSDPFISDHSIVLGQRGTTDLTTTARPHVYPLQTTHLFERYDPNTNINTVWNVKSNRVSISEGGAVRFTVSANNLPDGESLDWTIKEGVLNAQDDDIIDVEQTKRGTVILKNGQAIIDFVTTPDDNEVESQKHVRLTVSSPANLSINVPINDLGKNETVIHINTSSYNGLALDEYYKAQAGNYPRASDKVRFIVDAGTKIIASSTETPALVDGPNWPEGSQIVVENRGHILGRGGDGGRSAYQFKFWGDDGDLLSPSKSIMRLPENGGNGGTAIKSLTRPIFVENHSVIAGGGGGGGGLGAYKNGGDYNFVVGGGGTGGGAPFGRRSPNESTYSMYLEDTVITDKKLPLPDDGRFYKILLQRVSGSLANWSGSSGDYAYGAEYTASDINETRGIHVEISTAADRQASANFKNYRVAHLAGYIPYNPLVLTMSQSATETAKGIGGANLAASTYSNTAATNEYPASDNPAFTKGGDGGGFGENGQTGLFDKIYRYNPNAEQGSRLVDSTVAETSWYIAPASGGLAGYVKEGSVTINNLSSGTTKGR